ncbi:MAG: response regulator transcription factor [Actinomycetaceae bacterium]|nr:response regulator transcription factor [Actinomycetaceae bacterium]
MTPRPIRVLIAEDQAMIRSAFSALVDAQPDMHVVAAVADGEQAVRAAQGTDVALLDIRMPRRDGISAASEIRRTTACRCLMLTTFREETLVLGALDAGASGFLLKDSSPAVLLDAIRRIYRGEGYLDPAITTTVLKHVHRRATPRPLEGFTVRETEVLQLVCEGLSNRAIAEQLTIAETTVKTHVQSLLRKTGSPDRVNLVIWAAGQGLVGGQL